MDIHTYRSLNFIIAIIGGSSSHFEEPYNGQVFILPADEKRQPPLALNLSEAQEWCAKRFAGSTLPNIIEDGDYLFQFIKSAISKKRLNNGQTVLANSIKHTLGDWTWINGHDVKGIKVKNERQGDEAQLYRYGYMWAKGKYSIQASRPVDPRHYICEYGNVSGCNVIINSMCYRKREGRSTWFQARQDCKKGNGDLASFETLNDAILKPSLLGLSLSDEFDYWIGIRRPLYHLDNNGSEIRFINGTNVHRSDVSLQCLCLHAALEFRWTECDCNDSHPFICTRRDALAQRIASSATTISTKTVRHTTSSIDLLSIPSAIISTAVTTLRTASSTLTSTKDTHHSPPNNANATIGAIVSCCALGLFIIIIVVVIIIIRKHRNRSVNSSRNVAFETRTTTTTDEFPIIEKAENSKMKESTANCSASNTTYATVQVDAMTNEESLANNIVYAELDLPPKA